MDERALLPEERRRQIAAQVRKTGTVSITELETQFGVSAMTARRDLKLLEERNQIRRIHGGAVVPESAANEDSFQQRLERAVEAKERLAAVAVGHANPGATIFLDSSTTAFYVAKHMVAVGQEATVLTNSLPIMDIISAADRPTLQLVGLGGALRRLTKSFVGPLTVQAVAAHVADMTFLSVKGVARDGQLTDPDPLEAEVKRAMVQQCRRSVLLIDGSKLDHSGMCVVTNLSKLSMVLVADVSEDALAVLRTDDADIRLV